MDHLHHQRANQRKQGRVWVAVFKEVVHALLVERLRASVEQVGRRHGREHIGHGCFANPEGDEAVE